ncbi:phosphotransferase family protein [Saccharothrix deserti]|uniref:phosphotransferase family protein n=1 Tax=Saccharothrix deserti TaxID=2593674 RepID=UPI00131E35C6|nr:phosphotransferase family protein [Saccharothrix deserti]
MTTALSTLAGRVRDRLGGEPVPLPGGHSGLTYSVTSSTGRYVVKAVPPGRRPIGRDDVLRQARVLTALRGENVPVPEVVAVDKRKPAWFAMEFATGDAVEPVTDEHDLDPATARARMLALVAVLRRLHEVDLSGLPTDLPAPTDARAELDRWSRTLHAVPAELRPGSDELLRRLAATVPGDLPPVLLHGDFRLGNALCVGDRVTAVIDWEIWSVGDPRTDLAWLLLFRDDTNFPGVGRPVEDLPTEAELLAGYGPALPDMDWFRALGRMKMAAIMGHNLRRHREGRHHDPHQELLPPTIAAMIRTATEILG